MVDEHLTGMVEPCGAGQHEHPAELVGRGARPLVDQCPTGMVDHHPTPMVDQRTVPALAGYLPHLVEQYATKLDESAAGNLLPPV